MIGYVRRPPDKGRKKKLKGKSKRTKKAYQKIAEKMKKELTNGITCV